MAGLHLDLVRGGSGARKPRWMRGAGGTLFLSLGIVDGRNVWRNGPAGRAGRCCSVTAASARTSGPPDGRPVLQRAACSGGSAVGAGSEPSSGIGLEVKLAGWLSRHAEAGRRSRSLARRTGRRRDGDQRRHGAYGPAMPRHNPARPDPRGPPMPEVAAAVWPALTAGDGARRPTPYAGSGGPCSSRPGWACRRFTDHQHRVVSADGGGTGRRARRSP